MIVNDARELSLATLRANDPYGGRGSGDVDFLCPLGGCAQRRGPGHRSLGANLKTGAWKCHRCGETGLLIEFREDRRDDRDVSRRRYRPPAPPPFRVPVPAAPSPEQEHALRDALRGVVPIEGTPGAAYVERRGIAAADAAIHDVRFHASWAPRSTMRGSPAVVFGGRNERGRLIAAQGRYLAGPMKAASCGPTGSAVYASHGALEAPVVAIAEAPFDALSLAVFGLPSIATFGTALPKWLRMRLGFRTVVIATDADAAGEAFAERIRATLTLGTRLVRMALPAGCKDANEALVADAVDFAERVGDLLR